MLFSDLFCLGRFVVPWHQRQYDWKSENIRALLCDIDDAVKERRDCYFLGAVMLVDCWLTESGKLTMDNKEW